MLRGGGDDWENPFGGVDPGGGLGCGMEEPARMIGQPVQHLGVPMGGVVVNDRVGHPAQRNGAFHGGDERDERLTGLLGHAVPGDALHPGGKGGTFGTLEGADPLIVAPAGADCLGHCPPGSSDDRAGCFRAGQRQQFGDRRGGQRRPAGLANAMSAPVRQVLRGASPEPPPCPRYDLISNTVTGP